MIAVRIQFSVAVCANNGFVGEVPEKAAGG